MFSLSLAYEFIESHYEGKEAERSGVPYINHIDEGLIILNALGSTDAVKAAYCLHPIFQADKDFKKACIYNVPQIVGDAGVITLVMEYRNIANAGLRHRLKLNSSWEIRLSPLDEVNDMLIADKVQNYKDFLKYHLGTHPDSDDLDLYFKMWLNRLGVNYNDLVRYFEMLDFQEE